MEAMGFTVKLSSRLRSPRGARTTSGSTPQAAVASGSEAEVAMHEAAPSVERRSSMQILPFRTCELEEVYSVGAELGKGVAGVVRLLQDVDTGKLRAGKSVFKDKIKKEVLAAELRSEIRVMQALAGSQHVVQLCGLFEDKQAVHLIMELCPGGDLFTYIKERRRLSESEAAQIFRQAASALQHCHNKSILHRDIKPENILISEKIRNPDGSQTPKIKLADFGIALKLQPGRKAKHPVGTVSYMAPEVINGQEYGFEADVWSLGVVLYVALSGYMPFWGPSNEEIFANICQREPSYSARPWPEISKDAKKLVQSMLTKSPGLRPTASDLLEHPWLLKHCPVKRSPSPLSSPLPKPPPALLESPKEGRNFDLSFSVVNESSEANVLSFTDSSLTRESVQNCDKPAPPLSQEKSVVRSNFCLPSPSLRHRPTVIIPSSIPPRMELSFDFRESQSPSPPAVLTPPSRKPPPSPSSSSSSSSSSDRFDHSVRRVSFHCESPSLPSSSSSSPSPLASRLIPRPFCFRSPRVVDYNSTSEES